MQTEKDSLERASARGEPKTVYEVEVEIKTADGLHMRPAMQFVDVANRFNSHITVSNGENNVDGKSIMQMTMLAATRGTKLKIKAEGTDADKAIQALRKLMEEGVDETVAHKQENLPDDSQNSTRNGGS